MHSSFLTLALIVTAGPAQTTRPVDRDGLEYMKMVFLLPENEQRQKGRERAENDYAAGFGEIEGYGLLPWPHRYLDDKTGLYVDHRGCGSWGLDELLGYREQLTKLVSERGLPENARGLRDRILEVRAFQVNMPPIAFKPLEISAEDKRLWTQMGPAQISCWPYTRKSETPIYLIQVRTSWQERRPFVTKNKPTNAAYWRDVDVVVVEIDKPYLQLLFFDARYGRILHEYDAKWDRQMKELEENARRRQSSRPAPTS
jgi:hypothetical protein